MSSGEVDGPQCRAPSSARPGSTVISPDPCTPPGSPEARLFSGERLLPVARADKALISRPHALKPPFRAREPAPFTGPSQNVCPPRPRCLPKTAREVRQRTRFESLLPVRDPKISFFSSPARCFAVLEPALQNLLQGLPQSGEKRSG
ncbi:hypothetical protein NDU88_000765 [Pleurodeles waltl]|uniref:Uncharacterized protein n=1 Tax=Pleurodeles waltl TaxID=8319 RepID=A0AAV7LWG6_PLEWA|nr:hypothetical protein NDU88_000765 [Pleurodeles waltl]